MIAKTAAIALLLVASAVADDGRFVAQCGPAENIGHEVTDIYGQPAKIVSCSPLVIEYADGKRAEGVEVIPAASAYLLPHNGDTALP